MEKSKLHKRIMRRVYFTYVLQRVFSPRVMKLGFFSLSVVGLASAVSVGSVIANMPTSAGISALLSFLFHAFTDTTALVQTLSVAVAIATVWVARDTYQRVPAPAFG